MFFEFNSELSELKEQIIGKQRELDSLIYELYGLNTEEKALVQDAMRSIWGKHMQKLPRK